MSLDKCDKLIERSACWFYSNDDDFCVLCSLAADVVVVGDGGIGNIPSIYLHLQLCTMHKLFC